MTLDNFLVRPKRHFVEKYAKPEAWDDWSVATRTELIGEIAGLPSTIADNDVNAREFDLLVLNAQLALLRAEPRYPSLTKRIREVAGALEAISNIPMVQGNSSLSSRCRRTRSGKT